jgi:exodeoxyribonuclease-3
VPAAKSKTNYKLISWNVNGIRAAQKKGLMFWLDKEAPDIACFQETKAMKEQLDDELINPPGGYKTYWHSAQKKGYSGVATFSKAEPLSVQSGFGIEKFDNEGRVLMTDHGEFILFNIYFPNGKRDEERLNYKMKFYQEILKYWEKLRKQGKKIVICGDVNTAHKEIDLARPKENRFISGFLEEECAWIDQLIELGYIDTFREFNKEPGNYSWWDMVTRARDRNVGWRIDYFFITPDLKKNLKSAFIQNKVYGSDHCPVGIELAF